MHCGLGKQLGKNAQESIWALIESSSINYKLLSGLSADCDQN